MFASFTFWLVVLAVLISYLCASAWLRHLAAERAEESRLRAIAREFPAKGFDTSAIEPQIRRVRQDYVGLAHQRWRPVHCRAAFSAAARRLITSFSYFRRPRHEHELHKHDA